MSSEPTRKPETSIRMLPFGIPQLDELFGYEYLMGGDSDPAQYGHCLKTKTSTSIVGA